ncbi:hypothetical protein [Marininema halotolerans]|uniref:Uncharacterized protein n=1 Tax=Marininema halotolerans TaxID=1155944 RepID=A0A1I6TNT9_9BACL|nr:hypothetical protein [Marininema halotolerans]SFS90637.1 hypothetical protein SAMN05444972_110156 [Marininema halotolerans]
MKKISYVLAVAVVAVVSVVALNVVSASPEPSEPYVDEIVKMQPGFSGDQVVKEAERVAKMQHRTKEQVLKQMYTELKQDYEQGQKEWEELGLD